MHVRDENSADIPAIRALVADAFRNAAHRSGTEASIVDSLRDDRSLSVSLVAEENGQVVGHVAFSPVEIAGKVADWYGLGPVSVRPDKQARGIGRSLIEAGLERLRSLGARGCVVLGDPAYYGRFGFVSDPGLHYADVPAGYFQQLTFAGERQQGAVAYHPAFT